MKSSVRLTLRGGEDFLGEQDAGTDGVTGDHWLTSEYASYTEVAQNQSAAEQLGDDLLGQIAKALVREVQDQPVDWWIREQTRASLRSKVRRLLAKYDYPPDGRRDAVELVLKQTRTYVEAQA